MVREPLESCAFVCEAAATAVLGDVIFDALLRYAYDLRHLPPCASGLVQPNHQCVQLVSWQAPRHPRPPRVGPRMVERMPELAIVFITSLTSSNLVANARAPATCAAFRNAGSVRAVNARNFVEGLSRTSVGNRSSDVAEPKQRSSTTTSVWRHCNATGRTDNSTIGALISKRVEISRLNEMATAVSSSTTRTLVLTEAMGSDMPLLTLGASEVYLGTTSRLGQGISAALEPHPRKRHPFLKHYQTCMTPEKLLSSRWSKNAEQSSSFRQFYSDDGVHVRNRQRAIAVAKVLAITLSVVSVVLVACTQVAPTDSGYHLVKPVSASLLDSAQAVDSATRFMAGMDCVPTSGATPVGSFVSRYRRLASGLSTVTGWDLIRRSELLRHI